MTIVFSRWGSTGDVSPYAAVAVQLAHRGHRVVFMGNEHYAPLFDGSAVEFRRVGTREDHARLLSDYDVFDRRRKSSEQIFHAHYYPHLESFYAETAAELRRETGAMVVGGEAGSATAAERAGAPYVYLACSPASNSFIRSRFDPLYPERVLSPVMRWLARDGRRRALMYAINHLLRRRQLRPPRGIAADHPVGLLRTREGLSLTPALVPRLALCMWPDWFAPAQPDWPSFARSMDFPLPSTPGGGGQSSAAAPAGPVIATTGSIAGSQSRFYNLVVEACRILDAPAVLVTPHREQVPPDLPARIEWRAFAPFEELFRQATLVIHHGGIGTAALALAAGIPQIVVPMRGDQFDNGYRLEALGVARLLSLSGMTPAALAGLMSSTMRSRRVRERCGHFRRRINGSGGVHKIADAIETELGVTALAANTRPSSRSSRLDR